LSKQRAYRYFLYLALEGFRRFILIVPRRIGFALGTGIAIITYWILPKERAKTVQNLKKAFGSEKTEQELFRIGQEVFIHLVKSGIDIFRFPLLSRKRIEHLVSTDRENIVRLDRALERGNGAIVLTGHFGNWELLASYFRFLGYPGVLVGRRIYYEPYNRVLVSLRKSALVTTIYRDESPRKILTELKENHIVGISADQDIDSLEGLFVPFFGEPAWTPIGPAKMALASGTPIVPAFMLHEGSGYRLFVEEPIWPTQEGSKEERLRRMTEAWSQVVERYIRQYPNQWVWMHNRWKTKPKLETEIKNTEVLERAIS
jgi:KDO2-lipid IV(A) lauroyltransferase